MEHTANPSLCLSLALVLGVCSQALARHLRIPGIVVLLAAGVFFGPEAIGLVRPSDLGHAMHSLVGFAVAVILFEGGMNLDIGRLRREAGTIRRLISIGAVVTALGATIAAHSILGWNWTLATLFGTLVIVTGPTVISPLLKRINVNRKLSTVLDAEGVLIDPVGAITAIVALELAISPTGTSMLVGVEAAAARLGFGLLVGAFGGLLIAALLQPEALIPHGLENIFTLSMVFALFQVSETILSESGIMTVTVAGLVVGNLHTRVLRELTEFKEQLTVMLIGMLFVLLAADVRLSDVTALGWRGVATVLCLMFIVRPLNVLASTIGSELSMRERAFLCWLAPRGIVAAAVASLFSQVLEEEQMEGGPELRALVFLVIAMTVLIQGLSGGFVADLLGVRRQRPGGHVILGANPIGFAVATILGSNGDEVLLIDSSPHACREAEERGFKVIFGNALEERTLQRAELEQRKTCIGLTPNGEVNLLFARHCREDARKPAMYVALDRRESRVTPSMVEDTGFKVMFAKPRALDDWSYRLARKQARIATLQLANPSSKSNLHDIKHILPLVHLRDGIPTPGRYDDKARRGDLQIIAIHSDHEEEAATLITDAGWTELPTPAVANPTPHEA